MNGLKPEPNQTSDSSRIFLKISDKISDKSHIQCQRENKMINITNRFETKRFDTPIELEHFLINDPEPMQWEFIEVQTN